MTHFFSSLRFRLLLLILLAVVPALGLTLYTGLEQRRQAALNTQDEALRLARLVADQHEDAIESTRLLLVALAQLPVVRDRDPAACSALFADLLKQYARYTGLAASEPDGNVFCSATPLTQPVNFADRDWFQRLLQTRDFVVSEYLVGRISGKAVVVLAYPVLDAAGQLQAIVTAGLDLVWLNELAIEAQLPQGSTLTVIDRSGTVLARYPDPDKWVGQSTPEADIVKVILRQGEGVAEAPGLDGTRRLYAFTRLRGMPGDSVYVGVGIPTAVAYAEANRTLARNLAEIGLVAVLVLAATGVVSQVSILRRVEALLRAARRVSAGDLSARTGMSYGVGELSQLAYAFDQMAESLEQREAERERAEEAMRESEAKYRTLVEQIPAVIYIAALDEVGTGIYVSPQIEAMLGVSPAEWLADPELWIRQLHPDDRERVLSQKARCRASGEPFHSDHRVLARDGRVVWVRDEAVVVRDGAGQPRFIQGVTHDITERKRAEEQIQRHLQRITALREIDIAITASLDLHVTFNILLDQLTAQLGVDAADVLLFNSHNQTLEYAAGRGFRSAALQHTNLRLGEGHVGRAALERRMVSIPNVAEAEDSFRRSPLLPSEEFIAYYGVPLIAKGQVKGVLEIFHRAPLNPDPEWLEFLETLAGQAAIAIDNVELFNNLQRANVELSLAYDTTLEGWAHALELRDMKTEGHARRVTEMTLRLARAMGMSDAELVHVRRGALLHDMGKMGIPDSILRKPGPLTEEEWEIMRQHPVYAYEMLSPIAYLRPTLDIPYYHHEKWDGTGYPRGLKGKEIPLAARIFAVVDVWEALLSDRPYRPAWPEEKAIEYIREQARKHFDPQVVEAFMKLEMEGIRQQGDEAISQ